MRIALRRADGQAGRTRDLVERDVVAVLQRDDGRLRGGELGEAAAELEARLGLGERAGRIAVRGNARVLIERLGTPLRGPAGLRDVLSRVPHEPMEPRGEL